MRIACIFLWLIASSASALTFEEVKRLHISTEALLYDRNGEVIHQLRVDMKGRRMPWVALTDLSPKVVEIIVRAEDKRFFEHVGVDWLALGDAAWDAVRGKPRGASTLSMQVAAMLNADLRLRGGRRTLGQKWDQIQAARELEKTWSKRQILEAYLNLSTFRGEVQGVAAASHAIFRKQPSGLNEAETLLLASLLRGPNAQPGVVAKRACMLGRASDAKYECARLNVLALDTLGVPPNIVPAVALAPHVARQLLSPAAREVQSSLDGNLQAFATEAARRTLRDLSLQNVGDVAVLVVDNASGEVLAYVGNAAIHDKTRFVDGIRAARQAGSTLKPFLYQLALEKQILTAASLLEDAPVNLVTPAGLYVRQNYEKDFHGLVSVRTALSSSLNVPAVRSLAMLGPDVFVDRLRALGFDHIDRDGDFYGYSLALGSAQVTLWELVNAYRTLANGGRRSPLSLTMEAKPKGEKVLERAPAWIVSDILADPLARSVGFGLDTPLNPRYWSAVKTGTSKDMRDNWCVGFSTRYTVGVWAGNFEGTSMWDVSGVTGAAPLWQAVMNYLHRGIPNGRPAPPLGIEQIQITFDGDAEPSRAEWFLAGTGEVHIAAKPEGAQRTRIVYPAPGQIIALDPDIPGAQQRVLFQASAQVAGSAWRLNDQFLGDGSGILAWEPQAGSHVLSLHQANGTELDRVEFQVRGIRSENKGKE
ncbi:MAG: penicillin-binding protein 1C [Betaproteobacteria bacterium]|nr:penicillin-binding protein 1C [Betaproteobacteria bacterium]